jgi:hypothetical protein
MSYIHFKNKNIIMRILDGLSSGCMFLISYYFKFNIFNVQYFLLLHWFFSFLYHLIPNNNTFYLDLFGIHLIVISRFYGILISQKYNDLIVFLLYYFSYIFNQNKIYSLKNLFFNNKKFIFISILIYNFLNYEKYFNICLYYSISWTLTLIFYLIKSKYNNNYNNLYSILFHVMLGISYYYEILPILKEYKINNLKYI